MGNRAETVAASGDGEVKGVNSQTNDLSGGQKKNRSSPADKVGKD
jgi:hypothetical protein